MKLETSYTLDNQSLLTQLTEALRYHSYMSFLGNKNYCFIRSFSLGISALNPFLRDQA